MSGRVRALVAFGGVCVLLAASVGASHLDASTSVRAAVLTSLLLLECALVVWASLPGRLARKALWLVASVALAIPYAVVLLSDARWRGR